MAAPKKQTAPKKAATTTDAILADHGSREDRQAAHVAAQAAQVSDPATPKYRDDDNSIDARMARLHADHVRMGART